MIKLVFQVNTNFLILLRTCDLLTAPWCSLLMTFSLMTFLLSPKVMCDQYYVQINLVQPWDPQYSGAPCIRQHCYSVKNRAAYVKVPISPSVHSNLVLHELWVVLIDFHLFEFFTPAICVQKAICLHRLDLVLQVSNIALQWCKFGVLCGRCDAQKATYVMLSIYLGLKGLESSNLKTLCFCY